MTYSKESHKNRYKSTDAYNTSSMSGRDVCRSHISHHYTINGTTIILTSSPTTNNKSILFAKSNLIYYTDTTNSRLLHTHATQHNLSHSTKFAKCEYFSSSCATVHNHYFLDNDKIQNNKVTNEYGKNENV